MAIDDIEYFAQRAREERERAGRCVDSSARRAHQEMADRYRAKARGAAPQPVLGDCA
ncbi:hypothetical protein [Sphingomonas elodea]|uniref:hypothetical protein n=1 Tax=Sphingomonas elodea TaxID=179878 RepID=UPI0002E3E163|nr:hypothetical protein [Sphingomonas elodea]